MPHVHIYLTLLHGRKLSDNAPLGSECCKFEIEPLEAYLRVRILLYFIFLALLYRCPGYDPGFGLLSLTFVYALKRRHYSRGRIKVGQLRWQRPYEVADFNPAAP